MALEHHSNYQLRFLQQVENSAQFVLPFISKTLTISSGLKVLEIGCGEGGVLKPFFDRGCDCYGVDLDAPRIELARELLADTLHSGRMWLAVQNVYDKSFVDKFRHYFDLIILKDVIEHIPEQESFIPFLEELMKPDGQVFMGFPPWQMPFGGHQQIAKGKWTSKVPWYHLLPVPVYRSLLRWGGESEDMIAHLLEIKSTGISIERFEGICRRSGFDILNKQWFLINPIYKYKFGLKPRNQFTVLGILPYFRNFTTTCAYYTIGKLPKADNN